MSKKILTLILIFVFVGLVSCSSGGGGRGRFNTELDPSVDPDSPVDPGPGPDTGTDPPPPVDPDPLPPPVDPDPLPPPVDPDPEPEPEPEPDPPPPALPIINNVGYDLIVSTGSAGREGTYNLRGNGGDSRPNIHVRIGARSSGNAHTQGLILLTVNNRQYERIIATDARPRSVTMTTGGIKIEFNNINTTLTVFPFGGNTSFNVIKTGNEP